MELHPDETRRKEFGRFAFKEGHAPLVLFAVSAHGPQGSAFRSGCPPLPVSWCRMARRRRGGGREAAVSLPYWSYAGWTASQAWSAPRAEGLCVRTAMWCEIAPVHWMIFVASGCLSSGARSGGLCSSTTTAPGMGASPRSIIPLCRLEDIRTSSGRSKAPRCHARPLLRRIGLFMFATDTFFTRLALESKLVKSLRRTRFLTKLHPIPAP